MKIIEKIDDNLSLVGLNNIDINDKNFSTAYLRKSRLKGNIVFLIVKEYDENIRAKDGTPSESHS